MNLEKPGDVREGLERLMGQSGEIALGASELKRLDVSIVLTQETRHELPRVSEDTLERLTHAGWGDLVLDAIGSEAEAAIYEGADLKAQDINGKPALVRTDLNYDQKDGFGRTNLERMKQGLAPLDGDSRPIELHHIGQTRDAPLAELTRDEHRGPGNDNILHNKRQESEIDRDGFGRERAEHWKSRAAEIGTGS